VSSTLTEEEVSSKAQAFPTPEFVSPQVLFPSNEAALQDVESWSKNKNRLRFSQGSHQIQHNYADSNNSHS
jgi:hypothetical protein